MNLANSILATTEALSSVVEDELLALVARRGIVQLWELAARFGDGTSETVKDLALKGLVQVVAVSYPWGVELGVEMTKLARIHSEVKLLRKIGLEGEC